ncbi:Glycosylphosphatidylinositol (GPI) anchor assembly protein [Coemansia sp. RSA 2703]|nr:Glycosylphosphatidylinositol (GPI) anchor assembly protein [Coemansia sp. RSA 2703]KAJ2376018.1 Glycosylphosphatidylinositol (GPI) anchor assembly protein [Coemansia sp. RSA 2607]
MPPKKPSSTETLTVGSSEYDSKMYPVEPNGIELMLGGMFSAMALVSPRRGLNLYESPVKYLSVSATVLFGYYAILTFADIYCFKVSDNQRRRTQTLGSRSAAVLKMGVATLVSALVLSIVFVLFGAPIFSQHGETYMAAVNVSFLAVTPAILTLKADIGSWRKALLSLQPKTLPEKWAAGFFWCTMVTCWAGAYFVPMDWGRPWQRWPIPIVGGAFLGYLIGLLFVAIRCFVIPLGRADFNETERLKREMTRQPPPNARSVDQASSETKKLK